MRANYLSVHVHRLNITIVLILKSGYLAGKIRIFPRRFIIGSGPVGFDVQIPHSRLTDWPLLVDFKGEGN